MLKFRDSLLGTMTILVDVNKVSLYKLDESIDAIANTIETYIEMKY